MYKPKQQPIEEIKSVKEKATDQKLRDAIVEKAHQIKKPLQK